MITNNESGTNVCEIAEGIHRINTPLSVAPGGFSFNQYLIVDDEPLLFHTGLRKMFPVVLEAVRRVLPVESFDTSLFHISSKTNADRSTNGREWLPARFLFAAVAAMTSINDLADRPPRAVSDGEVLNLGTHAVRWFDTPHLPHAWECGFMMEERTRTLLCGDLLRSLAPAPRRSPSQTS